MYGTDTKTGEVQKVKTYFGGNARLRHDILQRNKPDNLKATELAATHDIRFCAAHKATTNLMLLYKPVLLSLDEINKDTNKFTAQVRAEASGLLTKFSSFETLLTLVLFRAIFEILGPLNTNLQGRGSDLSTVIAQVDIATDKLQKLRSDYANTCLFQAKALAKEMDLNQTELPTKRVGLKRRLSLVEGKDERSGDPFQLWRIETFNTAIDSALFLMKDKFSSQREVLLGLRLFLPSSFPEPGSVEMIQKEIIDYITKLGMQDIIVPIAHELVNLRELIVKHQPNLVNNWEEGTFFGVYKYILQRHLQSTFENIMIVYQILATIPCTQAEAERSFSKMKLVKHRLTNRLTDEHLSDRVVLACEQELMWELEYDEIIREFADTYELKSILFP